MKQNKLSPKNETRTTIKNTINNDLHILDKTALLNVHRLNLSKTISYRLMHSLNEPVMGSQPSNTVT